MKTRYDYQKELEIDAASLIEETLKDFIEEEGPLSDYSDEDEAASTFYQWVTYDGKLHEHTDTVFYSYDEEVICDESDNLETDSGLWEGVEGWREVRKAQAFWTLKADLWFTIEEGIKEAYHDAKPEDD